MPALQVLDQNIRPLQLQKMLGISEKGTQMLLSQCPDIAKLQPSLVLSRLSMLKVPTPPAILVARCCHVDRHQLQTLRIVDSDM